MIGEQIARLRRQRELTQEELADRAGVCVDVIRRLEQGQRDTARLATLKAIAGALDADMSLIIAPHERAHRTPARTAAAGHPALRGQDTGNLKRRDVLRLITTATAALGAIEAATLLGLDRLDVDRVVANSVGAHDARALDDLSTVNAALWTAFGAAPAKSEVFPATRDQIDRLITAMRRPQPAAARTRLCALTADVFQLAGEVLFDANRYGEAAHCYTLATTAAREAGAMDLWACALTRHAYLGIYEQRFHHAVPLLDLATNLAARGDTHLSTRHWAAAILAQALAGTGDLAGCERALDNAERVHTLSDHPHNGGWLRFDRHRFVEDRASCYIQQRRPDLAEPILTDVLRRRQAGRRRGITLVDLAIVGALHGDPLRVVTYGAAALDHARHTGSGVVNRKLHSLRPYLVDLCSDLHIRHLDTAIAQLTTPAA